MEAPDAIGCPACGHANHPSRRYCAKCGSQLGATCTACGRRNEPGAGFCGSCGTVLNTPASQSTPGSQEYRDRAEGERRQLTVLFCDLVGSTEIAAQLDPEDWHRISKEYQRTAADAVKRFGGPVDKFLGDGLVCFFGVPQAHEDDAERAVRAGLAIVDAVRSLDTRPEKTAAPKEQPPVLGTTPLDTEPKGGAPTRGERGGGGRESGRQQPRSARVGPVFPGAVSRGGSRPVSSRQMAPPAPADATRDERIEGTASPSSDPCLGPRVPNEVVDTLVARTDGVPLFVEELTRAVVEDEVQGIGERAIPATLQDARMARLDRLGAAKDVAQLGAVIGREFSYALLRAVSPLAEAELHGALDQITGAELLYARGMLPEATYVFKHALVQDAAYASLLKSRRRELHRQIAATLTGRFADTVAAQPEVVAHHYEAAGDADLTVAMMIELIGTSERNAAVGSRAPALPAAQQPKRASVLRPDGGQTF